MGKLLKPDDRSSYQYSDDAWINDIKELSVKHSITLQETIDILKFLEKRRANDLFLANGNAHDDQMTGLGELLTSLNKNIKSIKK